MPLRQPHRQERTTSHWMLHGNDPNLSLLYRHAFPGEGLEFEELRPWQAGDESASIDWHATARTDALHVRTFREERGLRLLFVVDHSARMHAPSAAMTRFRLAEQFVAHLSSLALCAGDAVGMLTFDSEVRSWLPPRCGNAQRHRLMRHFEEPASPSQHSQLDHALAWLQRVPSPRTHVILLSDFPNPNPRSLHVAARRHRLTPVHLGDPLDETLPPGRGLLQVRDPQTGLSQVLDLSSTALRSAWRDAATAARTELRSVFRAAGTSPLFLRTDRDVGVSLRRWLAGRVARK